MTDVCFLSNQILLENQHDEVGMQPRLSAFVYTVLLLPFSFNTVYTCVISGRSFADVLTVWVNNSTHMSLQWRIMMLQS